MAAAGLQPQPDFGENSAGQFLTFVVPAENGCDLRCSFCLVQQRREIAGMRLGPQDLKPEDFARFIREAAQRAPVVALAIQGFEPLLPASLPYTQAILETGRILNLPAALVTNGVGLVEAIDRLKILSPAKIAISLDAASADVHDRVRGVVGAWDTTVAGIRRALKVLAPQTRLLVTSVLMPSRRHYLDDMPVYLREIGIDRWIVSPLLRVGRDGVGGPVGNRTKLFHDLLILQQAADRVGVRLTIDDEFGHLGHDAECASQPVLRGLHVRKLPREVELFRLAPSGQCSAGDAILQQMPPDTPRWRPGDMHAGDFLKTAARRN
jgi:MoaA/NifB/PqqE/SkfB family radical SAM enzyme